MSFQADSSDVAIIGMSCRVAGAESPSELWDLLVTSRDVQEEIVRFNSTGFYKATGGARKGLTNVRHAYFLNGGIDRFDNGFFSIPATEAIAMDPQQRLLLELSYEAIENAGVPLEKFRGTDTGVYTGLFTSDYGTSLLRDIDATPKYHSIGTSNSIAANRLSYFFDLYGPSMVIDTACSSTMVALHQAVLSLKANEAGMALVCGANLILNPDMFVHMSELGFLSPSGRCKSFDASVDGYARGEGIVALLLKPLGKALRDGDPVRSVIRATRINQDGRTNGITLPSSDAQKKNMDALYKDYGLLPGDVQYLEAHGTGTAVGDPSEMLAVESVFAEAPRAQNLIVGSVKSNIGHLEACAALVGIVKVVECLERGLIPPQMHFVNPNPRINFENVTVPTSIMSWPRLTCGIRRAAVNSFGFGGTNGHVVLDHYPVESRIREMSGRPFLFKVSAANEWSLGALAVSYADYVGSRKPCLSKLAHTLLARRSTLKKSIFLTASSHSELLDKLRSWKDGPKLTPARTDPRTQKIGFIFTGQGAQWAEMGKQLIETSATFSIVIDQCDKILATLKDGPDWKIRDELSKPSRDSRINKSSFSQPLCTALQLGLVELWKEWGLAPHAVLGHSSGEIGAAYTAGILSLRDAIIIAYYRGLYMGSKGNRAKRGPKGAMCAVGISETECKDLLKPYSGRVVVAAINSPSSCTLSGDDEAINEILDLCKERGFFCRQLRVDMAYHSHHMLPLAPLYEQALHGVGISTIASSVGSGCEMFSSVTRQKISPCECTPEYWAKNMVSTVYFTAALTEAMRCHDLGVLMEIGPHPALKGPAMDTVAALGKTDIDYFSSCFRNKPALESLLQTVGDLINAGLPILTNTINKMEMVGQDVQRGLGQVLTDLPKYQWDHSVVHWAESRVSKNHRFRKFPRHSLLGARSNNDTPLCPSWRNLYILKEAEWLEGMMAAGVMAMPRSVFILMVLEAAQQVQITMNLANVSLKLTGIAFPEDLPLSTLRGENGTIETHLSLQNVAKSQDFHFTISAATSQLRNDWKEYCFGRMTFVTKDLETPTPRPSVNHDAALLTYIESFGLFLPPKFEKFHVEQDRANGAFTSPSCDDDHYYLDPAILSSLMQVPAMLMMGNGLPAEHLVDLIEVLEVPLGAWSFGHANFDVGLRRVSPIRGTADVRVYNSEGHCMSFRGMWSKTHRPVQREVPSQSLFYRSEILPDITFLRRANPMSIACVLELVTHKWPMSDFGIARLEPGDLQVFSSHLKGIQDHERARFRSLTVTSEEPTSENGRVRTVKRFSNEARFHMLISGIEGFDSLTSHLCDGGVACIKVQSQDDHDLFNNQFDLISKVEGFESGDWLLGRPKKYRNGVPQSRKLKIMACEGCDAASFREYGDFEYIQLKQESVSTICDEQTKSQALFDLVVMDCGQKSMLVKWAGRDLLPWIQSILERIGNLLWVSVQTDDSPFDSVAGSFIRTIQSEHPSIRAVNLLLKGDYNSSQLYKTVFEVYDRMIHDNKEVEIIVQNQQVCALRYLPDDELSASVGDIPPIMSERGLGSSNYELSLAGPGRVVLLSNRANGPVAPPRGSLYVAVEASVIDFDDVALFADVYPRTFPCFGLGQFFAGKVRSYENSSFRHGDIVVGWHLGAHRSMVQVRSSQLRSVPEGMSPVEAVAHYAAYAVAYTVVRDAARARKSERIGIRMRGMLAEALSNVCQSVGIIPIKEAGTEADFLVTIDSMHGLMVNGKVVSVKSFMESEEAHKCLENTMSGHRPLQSPRLEFGLEDFQRAFESSKLAQTIHILTHSGLEKVRKNTVTYKPPERLFRSDAAYVIVGGLGGLGRYLLTWMVANGARYLVTISRSGLDSLDAYPTIQTIQKLGGDIQVYKADACDAEAVNEVLAKVRMQRPIRGCLNMVLVLENSPFLTMTGAQWDRVLRSKIDTTWNLHQATLGDELDMFIMFSSISSISGNRTQANYATGNSFQNSMAVYRKSLGLPGISVALGVMSGIGVLASDHDLRRTLSQSGLQALGPENLNKIMEAAVFESQHPDRSLVSTGFEMFETFNDIVHSAPGQNQLFWTEWPEFGFLLNHKLSTSRVLDTVSLREHLKEQDRESAHKSLLQAFLVCLSNILGSDVGDLDPASSLASYGIDSLNAVSCRYWFFKELEIDVPVFDILGCRSINELISRVQKRLDDESMATAASVVPQPIRNSKEKLSIRPISRSQSRLWFLHKFLPDKTVYNLLLVCHISGTVDVKLFTDAWSLFVRRHDILHSRIVDTAEGLQQLPKSNPSFSMTEVEATEAMFQSEVDSITKAARSFVFDLEAGELIRGWLLKSSQGWRFFLASHHLAWDRASVPTIFDETTAIYKSLVKGEAVESALPPVPYQFIDYTLWQEKWMANPELVQPHVAYWKSRLAAIPEAVTLLPMALVTTRPTMKQYTVQSVPLHLHTPLAMKLKAFCKSGAVTPFMFMASAVCALVHRFTGDNDIVIGITDGDRGHTEFDRLVGFTVNMLAIRSKFTKDMTYSRFLEDYRKGCLEAYEHRQIPFDYLLQQLEVPRRTNHSPIFQITVNYQVQGSFPECDYGNFKFTKYDHYNARSQSDFMLDMEETLAGELCCELNFDTSLYDTTAMLEFASTLHVFIENILATEGLAKLDSINLIPAHDQLFISSVLQPSFDDGPLLKDLDSSLFPTLFSNAVTSNPTKPAIIDDAGMLTYTELDIATNRVAMFLINSGAHIGDSIGICCEEGTGMIIAMYGVIKAGCAYVPLDPEFPEERMLSMIEDVELKNVLIDSHDGKKFQRLCTCGIPSANIHVISMLTTNMDDASLPKLSRKLAKPDAFCCIFTSGSTGRPKGIYLGHKQLRYQMEGYHNYIQTTNEDRILLSSAMVFDMSLPSIYGTILRGATLVIASREARYSPAKMIDQLIERRISNCTFTTTQLKMLLTAPNKARLAQWTSLRSLVIGGEQIPPWVVRELHDFKLPQASVFNGYAPSETTVCNSLRRLLPEDAKRTDIPLERPLFPSRFHILNENLHPVPVGLAGELYIGGPTVNEGYVKRAEISATAFLRDPFASVAEIEEGNGKLYRTGDAFRLMRDGTIQALGRIGGERQVKIRGMRTELDEIENVIYDACRAIDDLEVCRISLVAVVYHRSGSLDGVLAAYLAAPEGSQEEVTKRQSLNAYLRLKLKAVLPIHMIPSVFVFVPELPRMVSGKIDYKAILRWSPPAPETSMLNCMAAGSQTLNEIQSVIASVWKDILRFDGDLSPADEFFALGGHSLILLSVQNGIKEHYGVTLALGDMFANPTIDGMEKLVLSQSKSRKQSALGSSIHDAVVGTSQTFIDWDAEGSLPSDFDWYADPCTIRPASVVAITGACTMAGAHFIHHVLLTTNMKIFCIGTEASSDDAARISVIAQLKHWRLLGNIPSSSLDRLIVYKGGLSQPSLGLTVEQVTRLDNEVHAIYQLDSEVSLLKRYESLRAGNVGSLQFLISLAHGKVKNAKTINYLSTWGVPHLQAWNETELTEPAWVTSEVEMANMRPGADGTLGYLKARWVCEAMLYQAARRGIPVNIFRSCMCSGSPGSGVALARTDINRRILEGSLQTGLVPDFSSAQGGGMSWITADFLVESMLHLSQRHQTVVAKARIFHIVSDTHVLYTDLAGILGLSYAQEKMRTVRPEEWFRALRAHQNPEFTMHAAVLEKWYEAGWVPFGLEAKETLKLLKREKGLVPPEISREMLLRLVVGDKGF